MAHRMCRKGESNPVPGPFLRCERARRLTRRDVRPTSGSRWISRDLEILVEPKRSLLRVVLHWGQLRFPVVGNEAWLHTVNRSLHHVQTNRIVYRSEQASIPWMRYPSVGCASQWLSLGGKGFTHLDLSALSCTILRNIFQSNGLASAVGMGRG